MKRRFNRWAIGVLFVLLILPGWAFAQTEDVPSFQIAYSGIKPPKTCSQQRWEIDYAHRVTTIPSDWAINDLTRYYVQYVNNDLNLVSYAWNGYSEYADTYSVYPGEDTYAWRGIMGDYTIPRWTDSYHALNIEYILHKDQIIWEIRTDLDCEAGSVADYHVVSQAASGKRSDLPDEYENLVVALADIPRYRNLYANTDYIGTIKACQTFYISQIHQPRASLVVYATDSLTHLPMRVADANFKQPSILDVDDNYGQPGGQPILDPCKGK